MYFDLVKGDFVNFDKHKWEYGIVNGDAKISELLELANSIKNPIEATIEDYASKVNWKFEDFKDQINAKYKSFQEKGEGQVYFERRRQEKQLAWEERAKSFKASAAATAKVEVDILTEKPPVLGSRFKDGSGAMKFNALKEFCLAEKGPQTDWWQVATKYHIHDYFAYSEESGGVNAYNGRAFLAVFSHFCKV